MNSYAADPQQNHVEQVKSAVDTAIIPVMKKYDIPGVAVGIVVGAHTYEFNYGLASRQTQQAVTSATLFELGSISKTFTATLASYAQIQGQLRLTDKVSQYLPSLRGSQFGDVSLFHLGTHTPGGLPLQVPDNLNNLNQLTTYFKAWQPSYEPGSYRTYSNLSIGLLGVIAAQSMKQDFTALMEHSVFPALGMTNTYIQVPQNKMVSYAQGYTSQEGKPVRVTSGPLSAEAYGIKSTAHDMLQFLKANMCLLKNDAKSDLQLMQAIEQTHTGYYKVGVMTQDLIWEQYALPVELKTLLEGNAPEIIFDAQPVTSITPLLAPSKNVYINKTGSTNGFGAYLAFVPAQQFGIVILANKSYPINERVMIAHQIMTQLIKQQ